MKRVITFMLAICLLLTAILPTNAYAAKKVALNKTEVTLTVGDSVKLKVNNAPAGKKITWSSNKSKVANVNKNGKVTAKKSGVCKITAKVAGKTYKCSVTVKAPVKQDDTMTQFVKYIKENGDLVNGYPSLIFYQEDEDEYIRSYISYDEDLQVISLNAEMYGYEDDILVEITTEFNLKTSENDGIYLDIYMQDRLIVEAEAPAQMSEFDDHWFEIKSVMIDESYDMDDLLDACDTFAFASIITWAFLVEEAGFYLENVTY